MTRRSLIASSLALLAVVAVHFFWPQPSHSRRHPPQIVDSPAVEAELRAARQPNTTDSQWVYRVEGHPHGVVVVFIHGIFGDTLKTWANEAGVHFYDLLASDPAYADKIDIFTFGFPSRMLGSDSFDIQEAANKLLAELRFNGVLDYAHIVIVAHSMGGLVILKGLLTQRDLIAKIPLLVFLSTPQEGAEIAALADKVIANPALGELIPGDKDGFLFSTDQDWHNIDSARRPHIVCAYEKRSIHGVLIVNRTSATRFCEGTSMPVDADHISIVKPANRASGAYIALSNGLSDYVFPKVVRN